MMHESETAGILDSVRALLEHESRLVLAVSGGVDSMSLLDAVTRVSDGTHSVIVASVDHGTGAHATEACAVVAREATRRGFAVRTERIIGAPASEAAWRAARWRFLQAVATVERATVATAHTRDDQVETVVMRMLRASGVRGLAGLNSGSSVARPLLAHSRDAVRRYAAAHDVPFLEDPTNRSRAFLRNRVRLDLLPAIRAVRPQFENDVLRIATRAATVRAEFDAMAIGLIAMTSDRDGIEVDRGLLATLDSTGMRLLWQSIVATTGITLDRRGIVRAEQFTRDGRIGSRVQVSGGVELVRGHQAIVVRRGATPTSVGASVYSCPLRGDTSYPGFRFRSLPVTTIKEVPDSPWFAALPRDADVVVRAWAPGDRLIVDPDGLKRRVRRFFADARIPGPLREGWPVVVVDGRIVWIPGVRRGATSSFRSSPSLILYRCDPVRR